MVAPTAAAPQQLSSDQFIRRARKLLDLGYFPIPVGRFDAKREQYKTPWIDGYHGFDAKRATYEVISSWPAIIAQKIAEGQRGILSLGIVLPDNILAMDVDAYKGEHVGAKLEHWSQEFGPLPQTYRITARDDESGIRLYRKPIDYYPQEIRNSGIDWIDQNHRFVMAPGSWHSHAIGRPYSVIDPATGERMVWMPPVSELPELPEVYVKGLESNPHGHRAGSLSDVDEFLSRHTSASRPGTIKGIEKQWNKYLDIDGPHEALKQAADMGFNDAAAGFLDARQVYKTLERRWKSTKRSRREFDDYLCWQVIQSESRNKAVTSAKAGRDYGTDTRKAMSTSKAKVDPFDDDDDPFSDPNEPKPWDTYPLTSARTLAEAIKPVRWLVEGVWPERSAGAIAGKKKTFKTWQMHSLAAAVSTGFSYLDRFPVATPGPVLYLSGEGGQVEFQSRHQVIFKRYGLKPNETLDLPFHTMFDVAPLDDSDYLAALKHHLDAVQPNLVVIDPLYAFHPHDVDVSNVYSRGQMLAQIRSYIEPYAALIIGDHINKSAKDDNLDLDDIGFSGVSQWADSWSLQCHRSPFVGMGADNYAKLRVEFGSRRTGSMRYDIDWHLVRDMADPHVIKWANCDWAVLNPNGSLQGAEGATAKRQLDNEVEAIRELQNYVDAHPDENKTNILGNLAELFRWPGRDLWRKLWARSIRENYIISVKSSVERPYKDSSRAYEVETFKRGREIES